jgi:2-polyprenyl-6-methoxyphenol hydroxylase-like FAD-dependent oxidoreductase
MTELKHVLIIGGGIGGLCLAQGLTSAGIDCTVYERDRRSTDRLLGYRVHISPQGSRALHDCLPPALFEALQATCGRPPQFFRMLTERMQTLISVRGFGEAAGNGVERHRSVSRITLRQVLLAGLGERVQFGRTFVRYETHGDRVVACFEDGSSAEGDLLVAADGGGSRVRRQYLPHAERIDTGVAAIGGKVFLDEQTRGRIPPLLRDSLALVSAPGGRGLFVAPQEFTHTAPANGICGDEAAVDATGGTLFDNTRSYLMWAFGAQRSVLGLNNEDAPSGETLRGLALASMADWNAGYRELVRMTDADTLSLLPIRTSRPVAPWRTSHVTLLGDAIHSMTPYRGIGANIALRDAALLCRQLVRTARGELGLLGAIGEYEQEMRRYGFAAVRTSLAAMKTMLETGTLARAASRAMLRLVDRVPALKRQLFVSMAAE